MRTLLSIPDERVPENLAFDADGNLYIRITASEVHVLGADRTDETDLTLEATTVLATLPGSVIGVEIGPGGTIYVAS